MKHVAYTDCYFLKSFTAAEHAGVNPVVVWQVFQKHDAVFCGLHFCQELFDDPGVLEVHSLQDGDSISPFEPAMIIKAHAQSFVTAETVLLGYLARCTRIATNVRQAVEAANGKPVLFFPARFDVKETQLYDGYAAAIGGAAGCATLEQQLGHNIFTHKPDNPVGTMPHALIAIFGGDTVAASLAFAESHPYEKVWVLVDFENDCARTAVEVYKAFTEKDIADRLAGVRLDTSEKLSDYGLEPKAKECGIEAPKGVCPALVAHVRQQLDLAGANKVQIAVSGGFTPEKISLFERNQVPADVYAVGEGFLRGSNAYTSDIVARMEGTKLVTGIGKVGRDLKTSTRLTMIKGQPVSI